MESVLHTITLYRVTEQRGCLNAMERFRFRGRDMAGARRKG